MRKYQGYVRWGLILLLTVFGISKVEGETFSCPDSGPGVYPDPDQCDKYWVCDNLGTGQRKLCPDGLAFHPRKQEGEDPCDMIHNVPDKCKRREKLQRPKPGDGHCPRQNGVYPSEDLSECDVFYSCRLGVGSPTKCAEGLHYSEEVGTCVWARDSGRTGCGVMNEAPKRKKKKQVQQKQQQPKKQEKPADKLSNGFTCPGGKLGVHPALPHPNSCRQYYVCLNGVTPNEAGCPPRKVFNPSTSACDIPANVPGCENYYDKSIGQRQTTKASSSQLTSSNKEEPRSSLLGSLPVGEFSGFLALLKENGLLKPGALEALQNLEGASKKETPRQTEKIQSGLRPSLFSLRKSSASRALQSEKPTSRSVEDNEHKGISRTSLFARKVPPKRRNKFTSKFIPRVKPVGNIENIHPVGLMVEDFTKENQIEENDSSNQVIINKDMKNKLEDMSLMINESDNDMLKSIVKAILNEDSTDVTTTMKPVTRLRKKLRRPGSLFNPESRRTSSIFNRTRTRLRSKPEISTNPTSTTTTTTTTATTAAGLDVEENLVETQAEEQSGRQKRPRGFLRERLRSFRRQRPKRPFRPSKLNDEVDEASAEDELTEMMRALQDESLLKKEFDKFVEKELSNKRKNKFQPSNGRDRSKIFRNRLKLHLSEQNKEITLPEKSLSSHVFTTIIPKTSSPAARVTTRTTTTVTTTISTSITTTTITTTTTTTTTTTATKISPTTTKRSTTTKTTITTTEPPTKKSNARQPITADFKPTPAENEISGKVSIGQQKLEGPFVAPGAFVPSDQTVSDDYEPFEYVYYEYYYDYEYEDEDDSKQAPQTEDSKLDADVSQQEDPRLTGPFNADTKQSGSTGLLHSINKNTPVVPDGGLNVGFKKSALFVPTTQEMAPSRIEPEVIQTRFVPQPTLFTTTASRARNTVAPINRRTTVSNSRSKSIIEEFRSLGKDFAQSPPPPKPLVIQSSGNDRHFPHFQNFKPINPKADPPSLPPRSHQQKFVTANLLNQQFQKGRQFEAAIEEDRQEENALKKERKQEELRLKKLAELEEKLRQEGIVRQQLLEKQKYDQEQEKLGQLEKQRAVDLEKRKQAEIEKQRELEIEINIKRQHKIEKQIEMERKAKLEEERKLNKQREEEKQKKIQREQEDIEKKRELQKQREIEKNKVEENLYKIERQKENKIKEEEDKKKQIARLEENRRKQEERKRKQIAKEKEKQIKEEAIRINKIAQKSKSTQKSKQNKQTVQTKQLPIPPRLPVPVLHDDSTFGPFSAFRNFPQFPRESEQLEIASPVLRGPNLLPTRPTVRVSPLKQENQLKSKTSQKSQLDVRNPIGPQTRPPKQVEVKPKENKFRPSPPLRDPVPPITVFTDPSLALRKANRPQTTSSLLNESRFPLVTSHESSNKSPSLQQGTTGSSNGQNKIPTGPKIVSSPPRGSGFQDHFFSIQTQLGQTNTRIPTEPEGQPQNTPFTFFNSQQFSPPTSRPVSFPGQQFSSFSGLQKGSLNGFQSPSTASGVQRPEQPRSIQSVFGSNFQGPFPPQPPPPNTFFGQGPARFQSRPTPNAPPSLQSARNVFNIPSNVNRQSPPQNQFPQPQFGGFRPIKRSFQLGPNEEEVFVEDLTEAGSSRESRRNQRSKKEGGTINKHKDIGTRRSSGDEQMKKKKITKTSHSKLKKSGNGEKNKKLSNSAARTKMQNLLRNELAKVYFEEFAQQDNEVDDFNYYYGDGDYEDYDEYYYYYEYLD